MNKENTPEIGKTYNSFDDGKIKETRRYQVTISKIVPFQEIDSKTLEQWKREVETCHWLYATETDFFIFADSKESGQEEQEVFVRTLDGGWFGIGEWFGSGRLDVDGSLYRKYLSDIEKVRKM